MTVEIKEGDIASFDVGDGVTLGIVYDVSPSLQTARLGPPVYSVMVEDSTTTCIVPAYQITKRIGSVWTYLDAVELD